MPDSSTATLVKKSSAKHRRRKDDGFDLMRVVSDVVNQPAENNIWQGDRQHMRRIVGELVRARMDKIAFEMHERYPEVTNVEYLIERIGFRKTMLISGPAIDILSMMLKHSGQESHYSKQAITSYVVAAFNDDCLQYGVIAVIDDSDDNGDIIIVSGI